MNYNKNVTNLSNDIEKAILSSIIFNNENFKDINTFLTKDDFTYAPYGKIYEIMQGLDKRDIPIEELFLLKAGANETALIEAMSANAITNVFAYAKELKKDSCIRKIGILSIKLNEEFKEEYIDQIQQLREDIKELDDARKLKLTDTKIDNFFDVMDLNPDFVNDTRFEYIYNNFIVKNEITMLAARAGLGKSLTTFALSWMAIQDNSVETVYYLDGDNSITTIKERNIHTIKEKAGKRLRYFQGKSSHEFGRIIRELLKLDLTNCLVVFDSIKNFMLGGDRDKNKDVSKVMEVLKKLRNNGATVIFLHHSNKPQKDVEELMYAGSSAWEEDASNAFILKKNEDKNAFIFHNIKARTGELDDIAFTYNNESHTLTKLDIQYAQETKLDQELQNEIIDFISSSRQAPIWTEIYNHLLENGYEKNKASKAIKIGEGKLWNIVRGNNNKKIYSLIEETQSKYVKPTKIEPIQTTFSIDKEEQEENNKKVASGTSITSGSPFYGVSSLLENFSGTSGSEDNLILPIIIENVNLAEIPFIEER